IKQYHQQIFPEVPVVFCGVNNVKAALSVDRKFFTGLVETLDISANVALSLQLLPKVSEIVIVSDGTPTGIGTRQMAVDAASDYPDLTFRYLNGEELGTDEMLAKLSRLEATSAVIAPAWYLDKDGNTFDNKAIYPHIAEASPVPVFGTSSANLGFGIIGGKINSGTIQGEYAANQALRILSGQVTTNDLPVETTSRNHYMFDYRQLTRFAVDERLLPVGSEILYRPFSFYRTYRHLVLSVIGAFCLFLCMIFFLLLNVRHLRLIRKNLARSEEDLRVTLHSIGDAVITTDTNGYITRMNRIAETLTGWKGDEANGKPLEEVFEIINAVSRARCANPVTTVLSTGTIIKLAEDTILVSRDSVEYRISDSCASIRNDVGEVIGVVLVFRDITKEYLREAQLQQGQKMEAIGQLAGGVAHDFNNMLSGIMGATELLAMRLPEDPKIKMFLGMIIDSAERAAGLTQKLLTFARKQQPASSATNVHDVLTDTIALLENTLDRRIPIVTDMAAESSMVIGDPSQLQSAFLNLGINASHAMPDGGTIVISTDTMQLDEFYCEASTFDIEPGPYLAVEVRDTGHGIAPENMLRIFEPFFTTKVQGEGTGLGLAAVFRVVQQHRGAISVYSELETGTSFHVFLPLTSEDAVSLPPSPQVIRGTGQILVIDDEHIMRVTAKAILESLGYSVIPAENGLVGLTLFEEDPSAFDLVILDMIMPEMSGRDCFAALQKIAPDVRVVLSSGFSREEDVEDMKANGLCRFIHKPFRSTTLSRVVFEAMNPQSHFLGGMPKEE
ncbi:MAG: response regulator, partial [Proteobacteria bacterium]|nr:response regulator [Pseudomonadota bacterium]